MISGNRYMSWKMGMVCLICFLLYKYITTVVPLEIYKQDNIMPKKRKILSCQKMGQGVALSFQPYHSYHSIRFLTHHLQVQLHNLQNGTILSNVWVSSLSFLWQVILLITLPPLMSI